MILNTTETGLRLEVFLPSPVECWDCSISFAVVVWFCSCSFSLSLLLPLSRPLFFLLSLLGIQPRCSRTGAKHSAAGLPSRPSWSVFWCLVYNCYLSYLLDKSNYGKWNQLGSNKDLFLFLFFSFLFTQGLSAYSWLVWNYVDQAVLKAVAAFPPLLLKCRVSDVT